MIPYLPLFVLILFPFFMSRAFSGGAKVCHSNGAPVTNWLNGSCAFHCNRAPAERRTKRRLVILAHTTYYSTFARLLYTLTENAFAKVSLCHSTSCLRVAQNMFGVGQSKAKVFDKDTKVKVRARTRHPRIRTSSSFLCGAPLVPFALIALVSLAVSHSLHR